ncbi:MAG TPA: DUF502 domain-containing protein, partial [Vicinamibacterales bacterium]|nr:DUF502 domain-containing protein [Vicinamibacterales bacterium]
MLLWVRRRFIAGLFVTVPLVVSVVALVWLVRFADERTSGLSEEIFGRHIPGVGVLFAAALVLLVGAIATNVFGRRVLQRGEELLLKVPVFRTVYAPVKQLIDAFAPDNEFGFKRVVMIDDP